MQRESLKSNKVSVLQDDKYYLYQDWWSASESVILIVFGIDFNKIVR